MEGFPVARQDLVKARLSYTALIKAALFAWNYGCPIANPDRDILYLARNQNLIIDSIVYYFEGGASRTEAADAEAYYQSFPPEAVQLAPILRSLGRVHRAVHHSDREIAATLAGCDACRTACNLVQFFERQTGA